MIEDIFTDIVLVIGLYTFLFSLSNIIFMIRHTHTAAARTGPMISVLIPARNEEASIGACLRSLLAQDYDNYEVIVLDDNSTDSTWDIICSYAKSSSRLKAVRGKPLKEGWNGKNYALQQLSELAEGEYLLFTDADTIHAKESLSFAHTNITANHVDMISGYPKQELPSISCQAVVSAMHFNILYITPLWLQRRSQNPLFGLAIGQYICIDAAVFTALGGFHEIRDAITDDIHLSRLLISHGFHQAFLDIGSVVSCRMYDSFRASFKGISRSIIDFFDTHVLIPILAVPLVVLFMIFPALVLIYQLIFGLQVSLRLLFAVSLLYASWAQTSIFQRNSLKTLLLYGPTMTLIVIMFLHGLYITLTGKGYSWKDRTVR